MDSIKKIPNDMKVPVHLKHKKVLLFSSGLFAGCLLFYIFTITVKQSKEDDTWVFSEKSNNWLISRQEYFDVRIDEKVDLDTVEFDQTLDLKVNGKVLSHAQISRPLLSAQCDIMPEDNRFDCHPEAGANVRTCESRGCCWRQAGGMKNLFNGTTRVAMTVPTCFYPRNYAGYIITDKKDTSTGISLRLTQTSSSYYPKDILTLQLVMYFETRTRLRIKIYDPENHRYEIPISTPPCFTKATNPGYNIHTSAIGQPFQFSVDRLGSLQNTTLINTTGAFMFADQFIQLSYFLPSVFMYGLGEHRDQLLHSVNWTWFTLWNKDQGPKEQTNLYGSHPFYLMMENSGKSHGVFMRNSNAMDVILQPSPAITWRMIGGIIDLYVFLGPSPDQVIQQFTEIVGRSFMPPYWSLGFHLCRYGYGTANRTKFIMDRVRAAGIPQDVQWNDLDYMAGRKDFTTDYRNFGDQSGLVRYIHRQGLKYIMIVDPGISSNQPPGTYYPYDLGLKLGIFVNDSNKKPMVGRVWPGLCVFPDFTNPRSQSYWTELVAMFHNQVNFDGIWLDMNEVSNFVTGSVDGCPQTPIENPPYVPAVSGGALRFSTLCASAQQTWSLQYNVHNLYAYTESLATYNALEKVRSKRPFIISRSTFSGQGQYAGHWTGDNQATFYDMYKSISDVLSFNMFGISMVGADICGFGKNTTEQLCQRWFQLGAFYPFSRSHNALNTIDQDPAAFNGHIVYSTKKAYLTRYTLLPYLYTLFFRSHYNGSTVARPLFFEYPYDRNTYGIDRQFLWGPALMISPVLDPDVLHVSAYFSKDTWYDFYTGKSIPVTGRFIDLYAPNDTINIHLRGGHVIPLQEPAMTTEISRKNKFTLLVALDESGKAGGELFWDDGETIGTLENGLYNLLSFQAEDNALNGHLSHSGYEDAMILGNVTVFGISQAPKKVLFNGKEVDFHYITDTQVLYADNLGETLSLNFKMIWTS